jgi:hypothetical protein
MQVTHRRLQPASGAAARPARRRAPDARKAAAVVAEGNRRQTSIVTR